MPDQDEAEIPFSIKSLDHRILEIPIPLTFQETNGNAIRESLLPYLALGFIPVLTGGSEELECGLYALMISFNAARKVFYRPNIDDDDDTSVNNEVTDTEISQWRNWLNGDHFKTNCRKFVDSLPDAPGRTTKAERQRWVNSLQPQSQNPGGPPLDEKRQLSEDHLNVLLYMANDNYNTNFRLGILEDGWRGQWKRYAKVAKKYCNEDGSQPASDYFDNRYLRAAEARMSAADTGGGPVIWIKNDNGNMMSSAHHDVRDIVNHWEGLAPSEDEEDRADRIKAIHEYGVGAAVEADVKKGVWYLTQDHSVEDDNSSITASTGSFLRKVECNADEPRRFYMRTCDGVVGWVHRDHITKIEMASNAPTEATDPTPKQLQLPAGLPLPALPPFQPPTKHKNKGGKINPKTNSKKLSDPVFKPDPRGHPPIIRQPFKIFRVLPPTDKAGNFVKDDPELKLKKVFIFDVGSFVLDNNLKRKGLLVAVTDRAGMAHYVPLRRLQALERPWRFPDSLLVDNDAYYVPPKDLEEAKVLADFHKFDGVDLMNEAAAIKKVDRLLLNMMEKSVCKEITLYRVKNAVDAAGGEYKTPCEKGEYVRPVPVSEDQQGNDDGSDRLQIVVNYEGNRNKVAQASLVEPSERTGWWNLYLYPGQ